MNQKLYVYLAPTAMSPLGRIQQHHTDWAGRRIVWEHSPFLQTLSVLSSPVLMKSMTGKKKRRQYGRFYAQKCIKHTTKLKVITVSVRKDSKAVDIVSVTVVNLHAFTRHHPPSYTGVITAGEKLHVVYHREPSHTVLMTCRTHISNISVKHCISPVPQSLQMVTPSGDL